MRQQVADDVHGVDHELAVLDADVDVRAEDEKLLGKVLHVLLDAQIALQRRDLLVTQDENGWVPAAAILRPFLSASPMIAPRRRTSSARTSAGVWQTLVPISTMDWCSSGLPARGAAPGPPRGSP